MIQFSPAKKNRPPLLVILGPTASGKSTLAESLAHSFNGEIVSADSRQIYQEMNIGTAKPQTKTNYHLLDIASPAHHISVAVYQKLAYQAIRKIIHKNKLPILCGGTGLYISAVVENWQFPKTPPQFALRKKLEQKPLAQLRQIYQKLDPKGAQFIDQYNKRRLIRAIEFCQTQRQPFWQARKKGPELFDAFLIGIKPPPDFLKTKIAKRIKAMIAAGLENEVKALAAKYGWIPTLQTIGYQEWREYFQGQINKKEVQRLIELHTRQYSKRQMTWFKKMKNVHWAINATAAKKLAKEWINSRSEFS